MRDIVFIMIEYVRCLIETSLPFITKLIYILLFAKPRLREKRIKPITGISHIREFKKKTTPTAMETSINKRLKEHYSGCAPGYKSWYISLPSSAKQQCEMTIPKFCLACRTWTTTAVFNLYSEFNSFFIFSFAFWPWETNQITLGYREIRRWNISSLF